MKLALLGVAAAVAGWAIGVEGLIYSGALWIVCGLLITAILAARGEGSVSNQGLNTLDEKEIGLIQGSGGAEKQGTWPGFFFMLAIGLGSMAIGILGLGFDGDHGYLRWLPVVVGAIFTLLTLISLPVRLGKFDPAAAAAGPQVPATLTIQAKRETGTYINEQPRIEFDLLVEPDGLPPYSVTKKATVPPTAIGDIAVGGGFRAKVDPAKPTRMEIDWNSPIGGDQSLDPKERLEKLEELRRSDLITPAEYETQRQRILGSI